MLSFQLKVIWFALSISGIFSCWIVLVTFSRAIGSYWGPILYCVFTTILQGSFCLGMIYRMDPYEMPPYFCKAQTFLIYYGAYSLTGVCAAFTFATTGSVLWPSQLYSTTSSTLAWRNRYLIPVFVFPLVALATSIGILLKYDAIQPSDDLHCDATHPEWGRFLGYAGVSMIVSIPCFFLSTAAAYRIVKVHMRQSRSLLNLSSQRTHPRTVMGRSSWMPKSPISCDSGGSGVDPGTAIQQGYTATLPPIDENPFCKDDGYDAGPPALPTPVFAPGSPAGSTTLRDPSLSSFSKQTKPRVFENNVLGAEEGTNSKNSHRLATESIPNRLSPQSQSLAPAVWRLILFQMAFFIIQTLAALSTILDVTLHRQTPTPFGTQHIALILAGWGPTIVFGHLPAVRRRLMFWKRQ